MIVARFAQSRGMEHPRRTRRWTGHEWHDWRPNLNDISVDLKSFQKLLQAWQQECHTQTDDNKAQTSQPEPFPIHARIVLPKTMGRDFEAKQYYDDRGTKWKWGIELATLIVLAFTLGAVIAQWDSMNDTLKEMQKQTQSMIEAARAAKDAVIEAQESREQTKLALDASIESFRLEQRPWVSVFGIRFTSPVEVGKQISVSFSVRNNGRTPALNEYSQSALYWYPVSGAPRMTKFRLLKELRSVHVVPPDSTLVAATTATFDAIPPAEAIEAYLNKKVRLYVHTIIRYEDVNSIPHWTTACHYHLFGDDSFHACGTGNDVDRNQKVDDPLGPPGSDGKSQVSGKPN